MLTLTSEQAMADLFLQHKRCRNQSDAIGKNQRPIACDQTKHSPDSDPAREQAVHRQGNGACVIRTQRFDCLRKEARCGESRSYITD